MKAKAHKTLFLTILMLCVLLNPGCEKKEENENPTLRFLQPDSNIIVDKDTLISFVVEPFDKDGVIDKVEFILNDILVNTVSKPPYSYDWAIETEKNIGNNRFKAIAYDNSGAKGEGEIIIEIKSYLSKWIGNYGGTSHHWSSFPTVTNGEWQFITRDSYRNVFVDVIFGEQDSCLNFVIAYNDSIIDTKGNLLFSNIGVHFSQWGGGSGYGSLNISFKYDSLLYNNFQKCGILCDSGIDFDIKKID
jgi:hypothetical protein